MNTNKKVKELIVALSERFGKATLLHQDEDIPHYEILEKKNYE